MLTLEHFIHLGKTLGIDPKNLEAWVNEKIEEEDAKRDKEWAEKEAERDKEWAEKEKQWAEEEAEKEKEWARRQGEMAHELSLRRERIKQLEEELERRRLANRVTEIESQPKLEDTIIPSNSQNEDKVGHMKQCSTSSSHQLNDMEEKIQLKQVYVNEINHCNATPAAVQVDVTELNNSVHCKDKIVPMLESDSNAETDCIETSDSGAETDNVETSDRDIETSYVVVEASDSGVETDYVETSDRDIETSYVDERTSDGCIETNTIVETSDMCVETDYIIIETSNSTSVGTIDIVLETVDIIENRNTRVETDDIIENRNTRVETDDIIENRNTRVETDDIIENINTRVETDDIIENINTRVETDDIIENFNTRVETDDIVENSNTRAETDDIIENINTRVETDEFNLETSNTRLETGDLLTETDDMVKIVYAALEYISPPQFGDNSTKVHYNKVRWLLSTRRSCKHLTIINASKQSERIDNVFNDKSGYMSGRLNDVLDEVICWCGAMFGSCNRCAHDAIHRVKQKYLV